MLVTKVAWYVTAQKSKGSMYYNGCADPQRPKPIYIIPAADVDSVVVASVVVVVAMSGNTSTKHY